MGILTIAFDDGYKDTFDHSARFLTEKGLRATFAVPSSCVGGTLENRPVMGKEDLLYLKENGHEIASHMATHRNMLDLMENEGEDAAKNEMEGSKNELEKMTGVPVGSMVFPFIKDNYNSYLCEMASGVYSSSRVTTETPCMNWLPIKDPFIIRGYAVTRDILLERLNMLVDMLLKDESLWLIEVFHLVSDKNTKSAHRDEPYRFFTHIDEFKLHVEHVKSSGISVVTQKEGVRITET